MRLLRSLQDQQFSSSCRIFFPFFFHKPILSNTYRKFNQNMLSVAMYLHPEVADAARILCRWSDRDGSPCYASRGLHELRIKRKGCCLKLERWSSERQKPEPWIVLYFKVWESKFLRVQGDVGADGSTEMVLFHDVFAVLKQLCPLTIMCDPAELMLGDERKLFRGFAISLCGRRQLTNRVAAESSTMSTTTSLLSIKTRPAAPSGSRPPSGTAPSSDLPSGQLLVRYAPIFFLFSTSHPSPKSRTSPANHLQSNPKTSSPPSSSAPAVASSRGRSTSSSTPRSTSRRGS